MEDAAAPEQVSLSLKSMMASRSSSLFNVVCRKVGSKENGLSSKDSAASAAAAGMMGTEIVITGPDVVGLLACISGQLHLRGYDIFSTKGESLQTRPGGKATVRDTFVVTRSGSPLEADEESALEVALGKVATELYQTASKKVETIVQFKVHVDNQEHATGSVLYVEGPDASGLLGAITSTLSTSSCSIISFGGETLAGGAVRDRFVITVDGAKLNEGTRLPLVRRLQEACRKVAMAENHEVENHFTVTVASTLKDTSMVIEGPDVPGLLSKLSAALASDGYEVIGFEAGTFGETGGYMDSRASAAGGHDVFRLLRDGKPLGEEEELALKAWITLVSDRAYHESLKLYRSTGGQSQERQSNASYEDSNASGHNGGSFTKRPMWSLLSCMPRRAPPSYEDATKRTPMRESKELSGGFGKDGGKAQELTNLERQGLIAALKQKGEALAAAADVLMRKHEVTDDEMGSLQSALGESQLSDVMKRAKIDPSDILIAEVIGAGVFGEVRAGTLHGTPIAVKTMHRKAISTGGLELFKAECELCLSLRHPNIVQLIGASWAMDAAMVFIVMERCHGTLSDALRDTKLGRRADFGLQKARVPCMLGIARAMAYLHTQKPPILHRDLKPDNVLLGGDNQAKVRSLDNLTREP